MFELGYSAVIATFFIIISMFAIAIVCHLITRNKKKPADQTKQLVEYFKQQNDSITTKQGFIDFYVQLNEFTANVIGSKLRLNMTKQEFEQLSIESIRKLNDDALAELLYVR